MAFAPEIGRLSFLCEARCGLRRRGTLEATPKALMGNGPYRRRFTSCAVHIVALAAIIRALYYRDDLQISVIHRHCACDANIR